MSPYDYYITDAEYAAAAALGISRQLLTARVRSLGWDKARAISTPPRPTPDPAELERHVGIAAENGISRKQFMKRLSNRGWSMARAATQPIRTEPLQEARAARGRRYSDELRALAESNGVCYGTLVTRVNKMRWSPHRAATTPIMTPNEIGRYGYQRYLAKCGFSPLALIFPRAFANQRKLWADQKVFEKVLTV